jgi:hypothetical protein
VGMESSVDYGLDKGMGAEIFPFLATFRPAGMPGLLSNVCWVFPGVKQPE